MKITMKSNGRCLLLVKVNCILGEIKLIKVFFSDGLIVMEISC